MSAQNIFLVVLGILIAAVVFAGALLWKPFSNPLLVSDATQAASDTPSTADVTVSHSPAAQTVKEGTHFVSVITYNGDTFNPRILIVNRGENVRFVNTSNLTMRIEANRTSTTTTPATYQQAQSVGKGGMYELSFSNPGVWIVNNINDVADNTAVIYVK